MNRPISGKGDPAPISRLSTDDGSPLQEDRGASRATCLRGARPGLRATGFTLIELLIVVAIIAILAAIAVPNFLEAQTRAKVSRTKADMRSVATAIESYRLDWNNYNPDIHDMVNTFLERLIPLTTPVAYITNVPEDFFAAKIAYGMTIQSTPFREGASLSGAVLLPIVYDYAKFDNGLDMISVWEEISNTPEAVTWALNSPGPDISDHTFLGFSGLVIYDPTNGTVSRGQIIRTSAGADDRPRDL
jgi:type II secretion system protein G